MKPCLHGPSCAQVLPDRKPTISNGLGLGVRSALEDDFRDPLDH